MFNVQTINCVQYNSEPVVLNSIIKLGHNHEINTHMKHLFKNTMICFNWKEAIWSLTKKKKTRKQERKANRIITLDGENSKKVELQHWSQKTSRKQNHRPPKPQSGSKWKTSRLSAMILHSQFNLAFQFRRQGQSCCLRLSLSKCLNYTKECQGCDPLNIKRQSR